MVTLPLSHVLSLKKKLYCDIIVVHICTDAGFYVRDGHTFCRWGVSLSSVPARPSG